MKILWILITSELPGCSSIGRSCGYRYWTRIVSSIFQTDRSYSVLVWDSSCWYHCPVTHCGTIGVIEKTEGLLSRWLGQTTADCWPVRIPISYRCSAQSQIWSLRSHWKMLYNSKLHIQYLSTFSYICRDNWLFLCLYSWQRVMYAKIRNTRSTFTLKVNSHS